VGHAFEGVRELFSLYATDSLGDSSSSAPARVLVTVACGPC
jgi:hypothetical protein